MENHVNSECKSDSELNLGTNPCSQVGGGGPWPSCTPPPPIPTPMEGNVDWYSQMS